MVKYANLQVHLSIQVLLDPTLTKNKDKSDWKAMKEELTKAGKLKVQTVFYVAYLELCYCYNRFVYDCMQALDRKNALLPLFEKTGRIKVPAIR